MRLLIASVGRLKDGPEREIDARYAERVRAAGKGSSLGPLDLVEVPEGRAGSADARKADEAERLLAKAKDAEFRVVLDERGTWLTSRQLAQSVRAARDRGVACAAFLIGGPDGHGAGVAQGADLVLALSALTLPHGLARVVLAEQLYRTMTIIAGHPYHRD